jgi:hypothetical protein
LAQIDLWWTPDDLQALIDFFSFGHNPATAKGGDGSEIQVSYASLLFITEKPQTLECAKSLQISHLSFHSALFSNLEKIYFNGPSETVSKAWKRKSERNFEQ